MPRNRTLSRGLSIVIATGVAVTILGAQPALADSIQADGASVTSTGSLGNGAAPGGTVTRGQTLARAQDWVDARVPYSTNGLQSPYSWWRDDATGGRYRQDCSGFVSMAWQLSYSRTTYDLPDVATQISKWDLQPGDILNSNPHVILFAGWNNKAAGTFSYYQESSRSRPTNYESGSLNASTLAGHPTSTYSAYRYNKIADDAPDPGPAIATASRASAYNPSTQTSEIFAVGADGSMLHDSNTAGAGWSGWTTLGPGAKFKGAPVAAFNPSTNAMELFALGTDNAVWHAYYFQGGWSDWSVMGATSKFAETPTAVFNPATSAFELFGRGTDNSIWHAYNQNGTGWSDWSVMNASAKFKGAPTAAYNPDTQALELFALGTDNAVYHAYFQSATGWSEWSSMNVGFKFKGTPSVAYNPATHALELFALGTDGSVWHNYIQNGTAWEGWSVMDAGSKFTAIPTAVFNPDTQAMELFGLGTDNAVWHNVFQESTGWVGWSVMGLDFKFKTAPAAVFDTGTNSLELFDLGTDNTIWHATYHAGWSSWTQLGAGPYAIL
ncbi:hypothetical protein [Embleya scabrispora]|uniref:hypothetical protein n=1 Tax=Embleya scabrispora TaxID=159449 RepID=UPI0003644142|nr:hypothetical protein [Embleya scabrispora]MYS80820.1 hypothetical protein [Streptomyces sp. SID5474]